MFITSTVDSREDTSECQSYKTDTDVVGTALDGFNKITAIEPWPSVTPEEMVKSSAIGKARE